MDYSKYIQKISKKEDRILIQESLKIIKCRQYRAAYSYMDCMRRIDN